MLTCLDLLSIVVYHVSLLVVIILIELVQFALIPIKYINLKLLIMKQKFISITTSVNGEPVEALSKSPASIDQLMAILQLSGVGSTITVSIQEKEFEMPNK